MQVPEIKGAAKGSGLRQGYRVYSWALGASGVTFKKFRWSKLASFSTSLVFGELEEQGSHFQGLITGSALIGSLLQ